MVSVQIVDENAPQTGKGRWSIPAHLIKDGPLLKYIEEKQMIEENQDHRREETNPQTIYSNFMKDVLEMA